MNIYQNGLVEKINQLHADLDGFNGLEYLDICGDQINSAIDEYNKFHKEDQSVHNDFDFTINNDEYLSLIRERLGSSNFQYHVERLLAFDEKVFPNLKDSFLQTFESDIIKLIQEDVLEKVKMVTVCITNCTKLELVHNFVFKKNQI